MQLTAIAGELKRHRELISRLKQAIIDQEFSLIVIFPTISLLRTVQEELLNQDGIRGIGGFRFFLFEGFIGELRERYGLNDRIPSQVERDLMIETVLNELNNEGRLSYLNRLPFNVNYRRAILEGIAEWKRSGLSSELFTEWASERGEKERELALVYASYQSLLTDYGFAEEDITLDELEQLRIDGLAVTTPTRVILYGFNDLTPMQIDFIASLRLWFDFEAILDPTLVPDFQAITRNYFPFPKRIEESKSQSKGTALAELQQNFWVTQPFTLSMEPDDLSLQYIQAAGPQLYRGIAREIAALLSSGYTEDELLIISPSPQQFIVEATPVFREYRIELGGAELPVSGTLPVQQFLLFLKVMTENWQWPEMREYLHQLYKGDQARQGDRLVLMLAENFGALSGPERWLSLTHDPKFQEGLEISRIDPGPLEKGLRELQQFAKAATLGEFVKFSQKWFAKEDLFKMGDGEATFSSERDLLKQRIIREMVEMLTGFLEIDPRLSGVNRTMDVLEYKLFFEESFLAGEIKGDLHLHGIPVISPREVRGLTGRVVILTGLEEGSFPRSYINDWKLDLNDRFDLRMLGVYMETGETYRLQEQLSFYWGIQAADERLYIVYQDQSSDGQPSNRSPFLQDILKWVPCLAERGIYYTLEPALCAGFAECRASFEERQLWVDYSLREDQSVTPDDQAHYHHLLQFVEYRSLNAGVLYWLEYRTGRAQTLATDRHVHELLGKFYGEERVIGITAIEDYLICPYRFFMKHFLKIRPLPEASLLPAALDLGNFYHQVFAEFGNCYRGQPLVRERFDEYQTRLESLIRTTITAWTAKAPNDLIRLMLNAQEGEIRRTLERWLLAEIEWSEQTGARFSPFLTEVAFGEGEWRNDKFSGLPPFVIDNAGVKVKLSGRVDRIDADAQGYFIIYDYKLGRGPSATDMIELKRIQLPAYLLALEQLLFEPGKAVGGAYLGLREPSRSTGGIWRQDRMHLEWKSKGSLNPEDWERWLDQLCTRISQAIQGIRNADFQLTDGDCPSYCEYRSCCRRQEREVEAIGTCSE